MENWYKFTDERLAPPEKTLRSRDRVPVVCQNCSRVDVVLVSNLKRKVRKTGTFICWSCSIKQSLKRKKEESGTLKSTAK